MTVGTHHYDGTRYWTFRVLVILRALLNSNAGVERCCCPWVKLRVGSYVGDRPGLKVITMTCGGGRNDGEPRARGLHATSATSDSGRPMQSVLATGADLFALVVQRMQVSSRSKKRYVERSKYPR